MTRQPGFYWVRLEDDWIIGHWDGWAWMLYGSEFVGHTFDEIDERRIECDISR